MIKLFIDADSLPQRHRAIILRRIIGKDYEAWFAADRALPDVMKAIEEDKRIRRAAVRETTTREEARRMAEEDRKLFTNGTGKPLTGKAAIESVNKNWSKSHIARLKLGNRMAISTMQNATGSGKTRQPKKSTPAKQQRQSPGKTKQATLFSRSGRRGRGHA